MCEVFENPAGGKTGWHLIAVIQHMGQVNFSEVKEGWSYLGTNGLRDIKGEGEGDKPEIFKKRF